METVLRALERRFKHSKGTIQNSVILLMIYGFEEFISTQLFRWDEFLYKHKVLQPLLDHSSIKQKSYFSRLKRQGGTFNSGVWDRDTVTFTGVKFVVLCHFILNQCIFCPKRRFTRMYWSKKTQSFKKINLANDSLL